LDRLIGDNLYVAGPGLSIADLMLTPHLEFFAIAPEGVTLLEPYPRLRAYLERMQARPSMKATSWERLKQAA